jgi:hypothetical protein
LPAKTGKARFHSPDCSSLPILAAMLKTLILLLIPIPAFAGDDGYLTGAEWRALVSGKTVEYSIDGLPFVREYYWPGTSVVTMEVIGETCFDAQWDYDAETGIFCFHNGPTACFWHRKQGEHIWVEDADSGEFFGTVQEVTAINDATLACAEKPTS